MKRINIVSLFSGCGGMDLGFEGGFYVHKKSVNYKIQPEWRTGIEKGNFVRLPRTHFNVVFANDILREAKAAWEPFFQKESIFFRDSIVDLIKRAENGDFKFPNADIVTGGFPCQDFSVAGKRNGFNSHKSHLGTLINNDKPTIENRGQLYIWMRKAIEIIKPKMFIAENVKGLVSLPSVKEIIQKDFSNINDGYYVYDAKVLNAAEYGVPQSRERVIFIGISKKCVNIEFLNYLDKFDLYPQKTHRNKNDYNMLEPDLNEYVTLSDVFEDLEEPENSLDLEQKSLSKARWYGPHCQGNKEINVKSIGPTIRAEHHGNIEFRRLAKEHGGNYIDELDEGLKERRLTIRECARIQTFPDNFKFIRDSNDLGKEFSLSTSNAYKLIGNAVPPLLAFHLAWNIQKNWEILFGEKHDCIGKQEVQVARI